MKVEREILIGRPEQSQGRAMEASLKARFLVPSQIFSIVFLKGMTVGNINLFQGYIQRVSTHHV